MKQTTLIGKRLPAFAVWGILLLTTFSASGQERFRRFPPPPEPMPPLRLPNIERLTLSNGLRLAVVYRESPPQVSLQLVLLAGENASPPDKPGTATAAAHMLNRGTLKRSAADIESLLEGLGGSLEVQVHQDFTMFSFTFLEENLDAGLDLLAEMILQPSFQELHWLETRRFLISSLQNQEKDPDHIARRMVLRQLYASSPLRKTLIGSDDIRAVRLDDVVAFQKKYYRPNNALMVIAGNLNLRTAARKVSHVFNTWASTPIPPLPSPAADLKPHGDFRVCFVPLAGAPEATICLGNIIPSLTPSASFPQLVFNQVLGGTPNSRLFLNLRESKGYAYYAFSEILFQKTHGVFFIRSRVKPEAAFSSVSEIMKEIRRAVTERIPPGEIEQAKSYLIGHFPLTLESLKQLCQRVAVLEAYQLGPEFWDRYVENIMLVSAEAVQAAVLPLPLLASVVVIAGDPAVLLDHLRDFDRVDIYDKKGDLQYTLTKER